MVNLCPYSIKQDKNSRIRFLIANSCMAILLGYEITVTVLLLFLKHISDGMRLEVLIPISGSHRGISLRIMGVYPSKIYINFSVDMGD